MQFYALAVLFLQSVRHANSEVELATTFMNSGFFEMIRAILREIC